MSELYIGLLVLILGLGGALVWHFIPRRRRLIHFDGREILSSENVYERFFRSSDLPRDLVLELWNEVAACLGVPPGKLRPSDRFTTELAPINGWEFDNDHVDLHLAAQRRLKKSGKDLDFSTIRTVRDYIEFFSQMERNPR